MIDWQRTCLLIRKHYKPLSAVAREVGSDWRVLNRLARGETLQPRFDVGVRLLDVAHDHVPPADYMRLMK